MTRANEERGIGDAYCCVGEAALPRRRFVESALCIGESVGELACLQDMGADVFDETDFRQQGDARSLVRTEQSDFLSQFPTGNLNRDNEVAVIRDHHCCIISAGPVPA